MIGAQHAVVLDRYEILDVLGHGGMGTVYRARDRSLGRLVAIKVLHGVEPADLNGAEPGDEARLLASLAHPGLVGLFDAVIEEERAYLVMELVEGPTLHEFTRQRRLDGRTAAVITADLASALGYIHERGIVHRDVKPANVLLTRSHGAGRPVAAKLTDFGIARFVDATRVTLPGTVIGTASYLSPEQALGESAGPASDVYSLGLTVLEAATGQPAFPGTGMESIAARLARDPSVPASLGQEWVELLTAMTRRIPEHRPTAAEVARAAHGIEERAAPSPSFGAPTVPMASAAPTVPLAVAEPTRRYAEQTALLPETARSTAQAPRPRWRVPLFALSVAVGLAVVLVAVALGSLSQRPDPVSSPLPSVAGPLGTHLTQLLRSVTP